MAGHDRDELVAVEGEELHIGTGGDGCGPGNVAQEGDLPEKVALLEAGEVLSCVRGLEAPGLDDVETVAGLAFPDDHASGWERERDEVGRDRLERRVGEGCEERHAFEQGELPPRLRSGG